MTLGQPIIPNGLLPGSREYVLQKEFFPEKRWAVSSQQPPTHQSGDRRRVDLIVEDLNESDKAAVLFMEAKRASAGQTDLDQVEFQALDAAAAFCVTLPATRPIWIMTCVGVTTRLWLFDFASHYLIPYVPRDPRLSDKDSYLDVRSHSKEIEEAIGFIKRHPRPSKQVLEEITAASHSVSTAAASTPGPSSAENIANPGRSVRDKLWNEADLLAEPIPRSQDAWIRMEMLGMLGKHGGSYTLKTARGEERKVSVDGWLLQVVGGRNAFAKILKDGTVYYVLDEDLKTTNN